MWLLEMVNKKSLERALMATVGGHVVLETEGFFVKLRYFLCILFGNISLGFKANCLCIVLTLVDKLFNFLNIAGLFLFYMSFFV